MEKYYIFWSMSEIFSPQGGDYIINQKKMKMKKK